ncbi:hypothetical protein [Actinoplanes xinjiangensis]|uniref:Pycsar effector protein domain-containing protein n=1 Tax=Actinoplanes xinjiangensis TaxID=512350 RepID=A0A316F8Q9_9ACTN|nr:hypothetical protein [Actinoplanes xinjiangensis]PWK42680.1 hypothetical protein BC793_114124 [Actinoplanes xinjiangensis]GIF38241.1 hypothetical protein Axi01nite_25520 [Actinoplanes xinjiangensis]
MTVEERSDTLRDLHSALFSATSLQETIRHADMKAQALLGVQGGIAVTVLQQAPTIAGARSPALLAVAGIGAVLWLGGLGVSAWHLLATIMPRLGGAHPGNRFTFPAARPTQEDIRTQRNEAWDAASVLADIALAKHSRIRRALPSLIVASTSAGALLALAVTVAATT